MSMTKKIMDDVPGQYEPEPDVPYDEMKPEAGLPVKYNETVPPVPMTESAPVPAPVKTAAQARDDAVANLLHTAYERASTLKLSKEEIAALTAPFPDDAFYTGAAGKENLIYIEHASLRERLNSVFGPTEWAIVVRRRWSEPFPYFSKARQKQEQGTRIYVEAVLLVRGCYVGEAIGDMCYYPNESTNYGDAAEGAKSAALRRCCKELSIGLQAWHKEFCAGWFERRKAGIRRPAAVAPEPAPAPKAKPGLKETPPDPAARPEDYALKCKERFLKLAKPVEFAAWRLFKRTGAILSTELLADARPHCFPQNKESFDALMERIQRVADEPEDEEYATEYTEFCAALELAEQTGKVKNAAAAKNVSPPAQNEFVIKTADEPWRREPVPSWSKHYKEGAKTFGDLDKKQLWWWCVQWAPKPWTDKQGEEHPPRPDELRLRTLLDEVKTKYQFTEAKQ